MKNNDLYASFGHGGDYTGEYLDFSANLSPLGMPDSVRAALRDLAEGDRIARYPDPYCTDLRRQIAGKEGLSEGMVLCGNGAADLIHRTVQVLRPKTALVIEPGFSEYEKALREAGCAIRNYYCEYTRSFELTEEFLGHLTPDLDLLVLCSPNNPTGKSVERDLMERILDVCRENGTLVLWDACFSDFYDCSEEPDRQQVMDAFLRDCVREFPNLLVLKSMTKTYAIPGLRLGYLLCADEERVRTLLTSGAPWSVSTPAQIAGVAALQDDDYLKRAQKYVSEEKLRVRKALSEMGLDCPRGDGNFLLLRTEWTDLKEVLKERGVLVRDCADFAGLDSHFVRFAIRTREENDTLLDALRAELEGGETP